MTEDGNTRLAIKNRLFRLVLAGRYAAVLGPRKRGKTVLMHAVHELLQQEQTAAPSHVPRSVFLDLRPESNVAGLGQFDLARILSAVAKGLGVEINTPAAIQDAAGVTAAMQQILSQVRGRVALLVSPLELLSEDVARELLIALRSLLDAKSHRLSVVIGGALNLLSLTEGDASPFNIAERITLPRHTRAEFNALLGDRNDNMCGALSDENLVDGLWQLVEGEACLAELLVQWVCKATEGRQAVVSDVKWAAEEIVSIFSNGLTVDASGRTLDERRRVRTDRRLTPILATLKQIESNPAWLDIAARLCTGTNPASFAGGTRNPEMCLAFHSCEGDYTFASPFFERVLRAYFTNLHIADCLVLSGNWRSAKEYYARDKAQDFGARLTDEGRDLIALTFFAIEQVKPELGVARILEETLDIAHHVIRSDRVCLWRNHSGAASRTEPTHLGRRDRTPGESQDALCKCVACMSSLDLAVRRGKQVIVGGGGVAATPAVSDTSQPDDRFVLCASNLSGSLTENQTRSCQALMGHCALVIAEATSLERRDRQIEHQRRQLAIVHSVSRSLEQSLNLEETASAILQGLEALGYPKAMISLLDKQHYHVKAVKGSPGLEPLVEATVHDMGASDLGAGDDILVHTLKTGQRHDISDCRSSGSRCHLFAITLVNPEVQRQIVFPLRAPYDIGWPGTKVFGTLQLINPPHVPLPPVDLEVLEEVVGHAAIALAHAILFQEWERLGKVRDRQLEVLLESGKAVENVGDIDGAMRTMLESVVKSLGASGGSIRMFDPVFQKLVYRAYYAPAGRRTEERIRMEYPIDELSTAGWVYRAQMTCYNRDVKAPGAHYLKAFEDEEVKSNCAVLIRVAGERAGVLKVDSTQLNAFSEKDVKLLETVSSLIGSLVAEGEAYRADRIRSKLAQVLDAEQPWEKKLQHSVQAVSEVVVGSYISLFLQSENDEHRYDLIATTPPRLASQVGKVSHKPGQGAVGWVIKHSKPLRVRGKLTDRKALRKIAPGLKFALDTWESEQLDFKKSDLVAVPLLDGTKCLGALCCVRRIEDERPETLFSHYDQNVLALTASLLVNAIRRQKLEKAADLQAAETVHQLAGPLALAHAYLDDLEKLSGLSESEVREYAQSAKTELLTGLDRVRRVATWEKIQAGLVQPKIKVLPLRLFLNDLQADFNKQFTKYRIRTSLLCPGSLKASADPKWLREILDNLVDNALHFAKDRIGIECRRKGASTVQVVVWDNGNGISRAAEKRLFTPRFTTPAKRRGGEGMGLGLAVARHLAELMQGTLNAMNRRPPAKGARFVLELK